MVHGSCVLRRICFKCNSRPEGWNIRALLRSSMAHGSWLLRSSKFLFQIPFPPRGLEYLSALAFVHGSWFMALACFEVSVLNAIPAQRVGISERSCVRAWLMAHGSLPFAVCLAFPNLDTKIFSFITLVGPQSPPEHNSERNSLSSSSPSRLVCAKAKAALTAPFKVLCISMIASLRISPRAPKSSMRSSCGSASRRLCTTGLLSVNLKTCCFDAFATRVALAEACGRPCQLGRYAPFAHQLHITTRT